MLVNEKVLFRERGIGERTRRSLATMPGYPRRIRLSAKIVVINEVDFDEFLLSLPDASVDGPAITARATAARKAKLAERASTRPAPSPEVVGPKRPRGRPRKVRATDVPENVQEVSDAHA